MEIIKEFDFNLKKGDVFKYNGRIYSFDGWDYGTYPIATDYLTGEQKQLPHL